MRLLTRNVEEHADITRRLLRMLGDEPALRSVLSERRRRWAIACLEAAQQLWAEHDHGRLSSLLDQAMASVAALPA